MLKKFFLGATALLLLSIAEAQSLKTPAASPTQTVKQDFGISSAELIYSRPSMRGRSIFGGLVPWGEVWRTGANSATRLKFADDVTIGGQPLKAGEYAVFTVPNKNEWEVIINKGSANWGTDYKQADDLLRIKVKPTTLQEPVETFTMQFSNLKPNGADLQIMWDKTLVSVPFTMDVDSKVMAQINNLMNKDNRPYFQAAMYYMDNGKDMNQALTWFDKAVEMNPEAYWIHHQRAKALAKVGRKKEAMLAATRSLELARGKNADYVRLNEDLLKSLK